MGHEIRSPEAVRRTMVWTAYGDLAEAGGNGLNHHSRAAVQGVGRNAEVTHPETQAKLDEALAKSFHRVAADQVVRQDNGRATGVDGVRQSAHLAGSPDLASRQQDPDSLRWALQRPSTADRAAYVTNLMLQADAARMAGAAISAADLAKVAEEDEILVSTDSIRNHLKVRRTHRIQPVRKAHLKK